jgi:hypothetical protein
VTVFWRRVTRSLLSRSYLLHALRTLHVYVLLLNCHNSQVTSLSLPQVFLLRRNFNSWHFTQRLCTAGFIYTESKATCSVLQYALCPVMTTATQQTKSINAKQTVPTPCNQPTTRRLRHNVPQNDVYTQLPSPDTAKGLITTAERTTRVGSTGTVGAGQGESMPRRTWPCSDILDLHDDFILYTVQ